jgi:nitrogen fixation protein
MKGKIFVGTKTKVLITTFLILVIVFLSFYLPKNERSDKMIVEFNDTNKCEVLLWNGEKLVARLYADDAQACKLYLIKNSSY